MMKRYIFEYWDKNGSKPWCLTQLSKSGKRDGDRISFYSDGRKEWQDNWKNELRNGVYKYWFWSNSKNWKFQNWKKGNEQGIQIKFK